MWRTRVFTRDLIKRVSAREFKIADGGVVFTCSDVVVRLIPRRVRFLDGVTVLYQGVDVWVPFLSRLRLRRVVRCILAEAAHSALYKLPPCDKV
jgi:hypothetical protein